MLLVTSILLMLATGPASDTAPSTLPQRPEFEAMARRLFDSDNPYFNRRRLANLQQARTQTGDDDATWVQLTREIVLTLLAEGETDAAVTEVEGLFSRLQRIPGGLDVPYFHHLRGLTYLRKAEVENCVRRHNADCCLFPLRQGGIHGVKEPARTAQRCYESVLRLTPDNLAARYLLNIASMALGEWPDRVPAAHRLPAAALASAVDIKRFRDVAPAVGVDVLDHCGGCVVDDFDGDGLLDIVSSTFDPLGTLKYLRNTGRGRFEDRARAARLDDQLGGLNLIGGDYNNDGHLDLFVLRGAWLFEDGRMRNSLLRNNGDGTFTDVTRAAGVALPACPTQAAVWLDIENDGDLDLYVGNESRVDATMFPPDQAVGGDYPAQLFLNNGNGTFVDVARTAGVTNDRYCKGIAAGDYDNDGLMDLYVSNIGRNRLYHNNGDGTFRDVAAELGVEAPAGRGFATWFFDFDNDGWLDIFATAYQASLSDVAAEMLGEPHQADTPRLYRNTGGRFKDVTAALGLDRVFLPMGANFGDLDNDGFLDIYLATGSPAYEMIVPNIMLRNDGGRRFQDVTQSGGFGHLQKGHGVAFADLDDDGDQDVFNQLGGFYPGDAFHNALFLNPGHGHHFVTLQLIGQRSNRSGWGARVRVVVLDASGTERTVHRAVGAVSSFGGSPRRVEIGLGAAQRIVRIEVSWPASQTQQVFDGPPLDTHLRIKEGAAAVDVVPRPPQEWSTVRLQPEDADVSAGG